MNVTLAVTETQQQHRSTLGYKVHKQGKLYYSLNMARNLIYDWEHDLKPRVDDHLDNLIGGGDSSTQFILASRHPNQNRMKPSVVILCLSKRGRKVILKSFRGRDWVETFREKNLKLRVIIDTEFGERAGIDSARALPRLSGPNLEISRVSLTSHRSHPSLCGARIKLVHAEELGNSQQRASAAIVQSRSFHSTMDYTITILRPHIQTLEENVNSIDHRGMTNWRPKTVPTAQSQSMAEDLILDSQYLLHPARNLERSCVDLTTLAGIQKSLDDSERSIGDTRSFKTLTYLTLIFLPLSFTSSVFSMNPSLKGQELGSMLTYWILISILILAVTLLFFWFNLPNAQKFKGCLMHYGRNWRNLRKGQDASNVHDMTLDQNVYDGGGNNIQNAFLSEPGPAGPDIA